MYAGADFIKTSTGKIQPAATMPVTLTMLEAIRDFYYNTGKMIGMKPAGGISKAKVALHYLVMLHETLGEAWSQPRGGYKKALLVDQLDRAFSDPEKHGRTPEQVENLKTWLPAGMAFALADGAKPSKAKKARKAA